MTTEVRRGVVPVSVAEWNARASTRERAFVWVALTLVVGVVLYLLVWQPLVRDIVQLRDEVPRAQALLAQARDRAAGLPDAPVAPAKLAPAEIRSFVDRTLSDKGLRAQADVLETRDDGVHVVFSAIAFNALVDCLDELSRQHGLRVVEATVTARVEPGMVRADLALIR